MCQRVEITKKNTALIAVAAVGNDESTTAQVAVAAAVLLEIDPSLTPTQIMDRAGVKQL